MLRERARDDARQSRRRRFENLVSPARRASAAAGGARAGDERGEGRADARRGGRVVFVHIENARDVLHDERLREELERHLPRPGFRQRRQRGERRRHRKRVGSAGDAARVRGDAEHVAQQRFGAFALFPFGLGFGNRVGNRRVSPIRRRRRVRRGFSFYHFFSLLAPPRLFLEPFLQRLVRLLRDAHLLALFFERLFGG